MKFLKKHLRDIPSSIFFILGMCLTMMLVLNVMNVYTDIEHRKEEINKYSFNYEWIVRAYPEKSLVPNQEGMTESNLNLYSFIDTSNTDNAEDAPSKKFEDGKIVISYNKERFVREVSENMYDFDGINYYEVVCNSDKGYTYGAKRLYLNRNEDITFDLTDGEAVTVSASSKDEGVYISECYADDVYEKDGLKYIDLDGKAYVVLGIKKDCTLDKRENYVYEYNPNESVDTMKNRFMKEDNISYDGIRVTYTSNEDRTDDINKICDNIKKSGYAVEMNKYSGDIELEIDSNTIISSALNGVLIIFAVINCIFISAIWVTRRKKEIIIRKANGYSDLLLTGLVYKDLFKLIIISFCIVVAGYIGVSIYNGHNLLYVAGSFRSILLLLICMVVISVITLLVPMFRLRQMQPAAGIKEV